VTEAKTHAAAGQVWAARAAIAERAVCARHLRPLWGLPGTLLGVSGWPATPVERIFGPWNYWWQAHLLDCLVDGYVRSPDSEHRSRIERTLNGIRIRAGRSWLNDYYDDMAWLALAVQRAEKYAGVRRPAALPSLTEDIRAGWTDLGGGGVWWRKREKYHDDFKNAPTNGPAAILFARLSAPVGFTGFDDPGQPGGAARQRANRDRARDTANWIEQQLVEPDTGLVYDGLHVNEDGSISGLGKEIYTYCQGTFLGACVELAVLERAEGTEAADGPVWADRAVRTIDAVAARVTDSDDEAGPTLRGQGGGDGGLFAAILARYLGLAAMQLPALGSAYAQAGQLAADLVYSSAEAAWRNRAELANGPLFGPDWSKPAALAGRDAGPERDLSVQAGGWMLMETAAVLERAGIRPLR
jgi:predicted alpha-1,6-mannanase (GH76 family)